jgi:glycosyl transferase family 10 (putative fucosyltransferase)
MLVAFRPPAATQNGDRLFHGETYRHFGDASHWLEPTRSLARRGLACGVEFHTDDVVGLERADVLIFGELPASRGEVRRLRRAHPHLKVILQILETPIGRQWVFDPANHSEFDAVVSYHPTLHDGKRYFTFKIPAAGVGTIDVAAGAPWHERKIACMIANVPNPRPWLIRRTGLGVIRNGWRLTPRTWWNYVSEGGSLYRERLRIATACEESLGEQFDIFGPGWPAADGAGSSARRFLSARGLYEGSKLELLQRYRFTVAYENCLNDCGYVTEKLFDALLAGCVPVYLGNTSIDRDVDPEAFVDARRFRSKRDLAQSLMAMPERQWRRMREAGDRYLRGDGTIRFGSLQYIEAILSAVQTVTSTSDARRQATRVRA